MSAGGWALAIYLCIFSSLSILATAFLVLVYSEGDYENCQRMRIYSCPPGNPLLSNYTELFNKTVGSTCNLPHTETPDTQTSTPTLTPIPTITLESMATRNGFFFGPDGQICNNIIRPSCRPPSGTTMNQNAPNDFEAPYRIDWNPECDSTNKNAEKTAYVLIGVVILMCIVCISVILIKLLTICIKDCCKKKNPISSDRDDKNGNSPVLQVVAHAPQVFGSQRMQGYSSYRMVGAGMPNNNRMAFSEYIPQPAPHHLELPRVLLDWKESCVRNWNDLLEKYKNYRKFPQITLDEIKQILYEEENSKFTCPISTEIPEVPVMAGGHLFNLNDIIDAYHTNPVNPMTRDPMNIHSIQPYIQFFDSAYDYMLLKLQT